MNAVVHADAEQITSFHLGKLPLDSQKALLTHLAGCEKCRFFAESMEGTTDPFVSNLLGAGKKPDQGSGPGKAPGSGEPISGADADGFAAPVGRESGRARGAAGVGSRRSWRRLPRSPSRVNQRLARSRGPCRAMISNSTSCSPGFVARCRPSVRCETIISSRPSTPATTPKDPSW